MAPESPAGDRLRDVARIWRAVDQAAGGSWTAPRLHWEAALLLEDQPSLWPFPDPTLVAAYGQQTVAEVRFRRAIPDLAIGLRAARPLRARYVGRLAALFGRGAAEALLAATVRRTAGSGRDLMVSYLFEAPAVQTDPARPRRARPDDTVELEEHADVEAEVEAAANWVGHQVISGTPLEGLAVLVPALDRSRRSSPSGSPGFPGLAAPCPSTRPTGLPLTGTASGAHEQRPRQLMAAADPFRLTAVIRWLGRIKPKHVSNEVALRYRK